MKMENKVCKEGSAYIVLMGGQETEAAKSIS